MNYYAHTTETEAREIDPNKLRWHPLAKHLRNVGDRAREFAEPLLADSAEQAGLLHDLGKYRVAFQEYLAGKRPGSVETHHAAYGLRSAVCTE